VNARSEDFRTLGLLGGMGPGATADVLTKIVAATPATKDQDHIPILIRCVPQIPDRTDAVLGAGPSPLDALVAGARALRDAGADFLAIACNTAHHWYEPVRAACGVPVLHIADTVIRELRDLECRAGRVGLLATRGTLRSGFYQQRLIRAGYVPVVPTERTQTQNIDAGIAATKAGHLDSARTLVQSAVGLIRRQGVCSIVLACTELPVALGRVDPSAEMIVVDANMALARACVRAARADELASARHEAMR